jgi:hypothetical protein
MKVLCDSEVIEILQCLMRNGMIEIKESIPGTLLRPILYPLFAEIGHDFFNKELTIENSLW